MVSSGEGWHNNHHAFPRSARHGLFPGQFDLTYILVELLEKIGLVWDARLARPQQLLSAAERCWGEIRSHEFRWTRPLDEALAIRQVRKAQVVEAYDRLLAPGGAERRRLCSLVVPSRAASAVAKELAKQGAEVIEDPQAFARSRPKWPLSNEKLASRAG
eukprot:s1414_g2.t1